ncbi:MAG: hypothetical protein IJ075_02650 [Lachnospiraceae bacterium]|nr:hypothetical protein [Lachnospiraceae bacterium]
MKKFLKGLAGVAIIGGIAAGVYYLLTGDKYTDFDDFDEESNDDLQDFLDNEKKDDKDDKDDHYVSLDLTKEKATEDDKIIGEVKEDGDKVVKADSDQSGEVEGFSFSDLTD